VRVLALSPGLGYVLEFRGQPYVSMSAFGIGALSRLWPALGRKAELRVEPWLERRSPSPTYALPWWRYGPPVLSSLSLSCDAI